MYMRKTKKKIFDAAIKVFSQKGYDGATMDDIAATAGLVKGTLYYHFRSKEEIFDFIIKAGMEITKEEIDAIGQLEEDSITKLKMISKVELDKVNDNKDFFKVIMSQIWGQDIRQHKLRESVEEYLSYVEEYTQQAMDEGFIVKGDTKIMSYTFFGLLCSAAVYELMNEDQINSQKMVDTLSEYILEGLKTNKMK